MIVYRVHESSLCHESINGADMIPMVRVDEPLIAAAPDLLAALKAIFHDRMIHHDSASTAAALAAIAKAEGRGSSPPVDPARS